MENNDKENYLYRIVIIRDSCDIAKIYEDWKKLLANESYRHPSVDPDHYLLELQSYGDKAKPYIICIYKNNELSSMLIARKERERLPLRLGYLKLYKAPVRQIHIFRHGIIGEKNKKICSFFLYAIRKGLASGEADLAIFTHIRIDGILYQLIKSISNPLRLVFFGKRDGYWIMDLPDSIESFYKQRTRKHRLYLKNQIKNLEKSYNVRLEKYARDAEVIKALKEAASISIKTYQHSLDWGIQYDDRTKNYFKLLSKKGWLRLYILYINEEAASYEWGIKYENLFVLSQMGHDPRWNKISLGTILFQKVLSDLIGTEKIKTLDLGVGDHPYKQRFGTKRIEVEGIYMFAFKPYSILIGTAFFVFSSIYKASISLLRATNLEKNLKKIWKEKLL